MKKAFFLILILAEVCHAQVPVPVIQPPSTQNHELAPQAEQYFWDTIANNWNYNLTMYLNYTGDRMTSNYAIDTITGVPIQFDTTVYDTLGRVTDMWQQTWNQRQTGALFIITGTVSTGRSSMVIPCMRCMIFREMKLTVTIGSMTYLPEFSNHRDEH